MNYFRNLLPLTSTLLLHAVLALIPTSDRLRADSLDNWQWKNPLPTGNQLNGIAYGNGLFVAVGGLGTVVTSPDGVTWTVRSSGSTNNLNGVGFGNGIFVAVGAHGTVLTSPDGVTWTTRISGSANDLNGVAYGNGFFVVVGGNGYNIGSTLLTSSTGISWTSRTTGITASLYGVGFGNGTFVVVGYGGVILTSTDGVGWPARSSGYDMVFSFLSVTYGNGMFVVVGKGVGYPDSYIYTSPDGITWTSRVANHNGGELTAVSFGNGTFVAAGRAALVTSPDGVSWTDRDFPDTPEFHAVSFGNGSFVAVGALSYEYVMSAIATSPNGVGWVIRNSGSTKDLYCIATGNGKLVVGGEATILTSPTGADWTTQTPGTTYVLAGVGWGNGNFVAVGYHTVLTSPDGVTWTSRTIAAGSLNGVAWGGGAFVAVGDQGSIYSSTDGVGWPARNSGTSQHLTGIAYGNGVFVAVGSSGTILTSSDGVTWTSRSSGTTVSLSGITFGNGVFVAVGDGRVLTSANGINWNSPQFISWNLRGIAYGNGTYLAVGDNGTILTAPDAASWTSRFSGTTQRLRGVVYAGSSFVVVGDKGTILVSVGTPPPSPTITTGSPLPSSVVSNIYSVTLSATGGETPYTWAVVSGNLPAGLTLSPTTGRIDGTPTALGVANFVVRVTSANGQFADKTFSLTITPPVPPTITTTSPLTNGAVGSVYGNTLTASGGKSPYTWSIVSNSLPAGLGLNTSTGAITGTPTVVTTTNFTVRITGADTLYSEKMFSLTITPPVPPTITSASPLPNGSVGNVYNKTLAASGGTLPYSWSAISNSLPAWLTLNASTGAITGTPVTATNVSFTVRVTGGDGLFSQRTFALKVLGAPPMITTTNLPLGMVNVPYDQALSATGGSPPYQWALAPNSAEPCGLSLTGSRIVGIPSTPCNKGFTLRCTDVDGLSADKFFSIVIAPESVKPILTTASSLPAALVWVTYHQTLRAIGGTTPYSWTVIGNGLPNGMTLNRDTGEISGLASAVATYNFTIRCTGRDGQYNEASYGLAVNPAPFTITSSPAITNATALYAGTSIVRGGELLGFTVNALDDDGTPLTCGWDFGDGDTSSSWNPTHLFTNCGPFTVTASISDGTITINTALVVSVACPFAVLPKPIGLQMKVNFGTNKTDQASVAGYIELPAGFAVTNIGAGLSVGGVDMAVTLIKGNGLSGMNSLKLLHKGRATSVLWQVTGKLRGDYSSVWEEDGLINATTNLTVRMPVMLILNSDPPESFYVEQNLLYKATAGKSGSAK